RRCPRARGPDGRRGRGRRVEPLRRGREARRGADDRRAQRSPTFTAMRVEAAARNEELFRTVNEKIEAVSQTVPATDPNMEFLCECDDVDCVETVRLTVAEYEAVRAVPTHFVVLPEHVDP